MNFCFIIDKITLKVSLLCYKFDNSSTFVAQINKNAIFIYL